MLVAADMLDIFCFGDDTGTEFETESRLCLQIMKMTFRCPSLKRKVELWIFAIIFAWTLIVCLPIFFRKMTRTTKQQPIIERFWLANTRKIKGFVPPIPFLHGALGLYLGSAYSCHKWRFGALQLTLEINRQWVGWFRRLTERCPIYTYGLHGSYRSPW